MQGMQQPFRAASASAARRHISPPLPASLSPTAAGPIHRFPSEEIAKITRDVVIRSAAAVAAREEKCAARPRIPLFIPVVEQ